MKHFSLGQVRGLALLTALLVLLAVGTAAEAQTWGKTYHGPWTDWWTSTTIRDFIITSDGGYAAVGTSNGHGVLVKLTGDGTLAWSKVVSPGFESRTTELSGIVQTKDGGYAVTGWAFVDPEKGGHDNWEAYVVRLDASGAVSWERVYGRVKTSSASYAASYGKRIYENGDGTITVTGTVLFGNIGKDCPYSGYESGLVLNIGADGSLLSHYIIAGSFLGGPKNEVYKTKDGGYIVGITHFYDHPLWYTLNVQKYSATGGLEWTSGYYGDNGDTYEYFYEHSIAEVDDGYLVAANTSTGRYRLFKVDEAGAVVWQKRYKIYSSGDSAYPVQIVETGDGGTIVSLRSAYTTVDDVLLKTDDSGDMEWANYYDGHYMALARQVGDGFAIATSEYDFLFARLTGGGFLENRCAALPVSAHEVTEEEASAPVVLPGKGYISCNEAVAGGTWTAAVPDPGLLTGLAYRQVDACVPKLTASPSPVTFYDTKVGLSSTLGATLSNYSGLGDIHINGLSLSDTVNFALQADGCSGQTISRVNFPPYGNNCTLQVVFTPKSKGLKVATLNISSDYPGALSGVEVRGTGYLPTYNLYVGVTPSGKGSVAVDPSGTVFDEGTVVTLTAQPVPGYHFDRWTGSLTGSVNPAQLTMTAGKSVTAVFAPDVKRLTVERLGAGDGTVTSVPSGISCGTDCVEDYIVGTTVSLNPVAARGSVFAYWSGACTGETPTCVVTMNADTAVTAVFVPLKTKGVKLTVTPVKVSKGTGVVTSSDGTITCGKDCSEDFYLNAPVLLTATAVPDSVFAGWTNCPAPSGTTCSLTMDKAYAVKATFIGPSLLTVGKTSVNKGKGTVVSTPSAIDCGPSCTTAKAAFRKDTPVTLTATPDTTSVFTRWTNCPSPSGATCSLPMDKAHAVKATFTGPSLLKVTMTLKNKATGTVTSSPPGISCPGACSASYLANTTVVLIATPGPGSTFTGWTGCDSFVDTTCTVAMTKGKGVKATFDKPKVTGGPDTVEEVGEE